MYVAELRNRSFYSQFVISDEFYSRYPSGVVGSNDETLHLCMLVVFGRCTENNSFNKEINMAKDMS